MTYRKGQIVYHKNSHLGVRYLLEVSSLYFFVLIKSRELIELASVSVVLLVMSGWSHVFFSPIILLTRTFECWSFHQIFAVDIIEEKFE